MASPLVLGEWLVFFVVTEAVESPLYYAALPGRIPGRIVKALGASALTHPIVWFGFRLHWPWSFWSMLIAAEGFAILVEAAYLYGLGTRRPLRWSLSANFASMSAALALQGLGVL